MLVYFYDKTLEGLLTAVFDSFSRKSFPTMLLGVGDIEPLFATETYTVVSDESKATRVWNGLNKKLSKGAFNMLTYVWLSEESGSDELLMRYIYKVFNNKQSIESNFGDPDVLQMQQIARRVDHEKFYIMQFVRFQKTADDIFFSIVNPICNALPIALSHFEDRFADQRWILYDIKRKYGYYYDLEKVEEITLEDDQHLLDGKLSESLQASDEKMFQELWRSYFGAMTIKERINPKLQRQHMPKRFWKFLIEKQ